MINCPNCDKQIADDSAHCGYCGHQLEDKTKKKTMFGMAALGGDELKKAVEQAKEAKKEQGEDSDDAGESEKGAGLKIPRPGQGADNQRANKVGGEKGGFGIPKPGQEKPEPDQPEADQAEADQAGPAHGDQAGLAKTERIDLSDASLPEDSEADDSPADPSPANQPPAVDDPGAPTEPTIGEPVGPGPSQVSTAGAQSGPFGPGAEGRPSEPGPPAEQIEPGAAAPAGGPAGPTPAAQEGGFGQQQFDTTPPGQQPVSHGQKPLQNPLQTRDEDQGKSKKGLIIGIVLATMLLGGGCTIALAYWAYTALF